MGNGRYIGWCALAFARQVRHLYHAATRITASIGAAVLVVTATVLLAPTSTVSPALKLSADSTALILGRTSVPTPNDAYVETVKNQYIAPTHPGQDINYIAVTTPQEFWPLSALLFRLPGLVLGPREIWGPGGPGWPDEPWWKLSGLFDLTVNQSLHAGVGDLEQAMAQYGNDNLVIYGYQQGAAVANVEKRKLAEQYPVGTKAPDIDFVLGGDPNLPNGGFASRFSGLYIPILDLLYNGPAPTDTQFDTIVIVRQYDFEDFPLYPLNIVAVLNALLGAPYVNFYGFDVSLAPDPSTPAPIKTKHGDTTYYFFPTADLPLFGPLRTLGVPESLIDVVEPFFRVIVELGYDRSIQLWEPTPARLFPTLDPVKVATDLVNAIGEGINNALALVGAPPLLRIPAPVTLAAPATEPAKADLSSPPLPSASAAVISTTAEPADAAPANETGKADVSQSVTPTRKRTRTAQVMSPEFATGNEQTSTDTATSKKDMTEIAKAGEASTRPTAVSAPNSSANTSTSESVKPSERAATLRPPKRNSLGISEESRDLAHGGAGGHRITRTTAADEGSLN
jgi:PE-PPE domain